MHYGVFIFPTDYSIRIDELARAAEERGFESLFVTEHTHIPTSRRSPFAGGGPLPKEYSHTLDPFIGLTAAAAATQAAQGRHGHLSRHRARPDHARQDDREPRSPLERTIPLRHRGRLERGRNGEPLDGLQDALPAAARADPRDAEIWTKDEAEFHGEFVNFDPIWSYPKPVQKPHPPVLLGGESGHTLQRVVDFCDGWFPRGRNAEAILPGLADLKARAARRVAIPRRSRSRCSRAKPERATLDAYASAGITRAIFRLPSEGRDTVLPLLDQYAKLIR